MSMELTRRKEKNGDDIITAYLSHNFGARFKVRDEVQPVLEEVFSHLRFHNPFLREGREHLFEYAGASEKEAEELNAEKNIDGMMIIEQDIMEVETCDMLVAFIYKASIGTACEIFYNSYILGRHTILVFDDNDEAQDLKHHAWLTGMADEIYDLSQIKEMT